MCIKQAQREVSYFALQKKQSQATAGVTRQVYRTQVLIYLFTSKNPNKIKYAIKLYCNNLPL